MPSDTLTQEKPVYEAFDADLTEELAGAPEIELPAAAVEPEEPVATAAEVEEAEPQGGEAEAALQEEPSGEEDFPPYLLDEVGLSAEEARSQFGSRDVLQAAVDAMTRRLIRSSRPPAQAGPAPAPPPVAAQQPAVMPIGELFPKFDPKLDSSQWDEGTIGLVNDLSEHFHKQITELAEIQAALLSRQEESVRQERTRQETVEVSQFDDAINQLSSSLEFGKLFGKGTVRNLHPGSPEFRNRARVFEVQRLLREARAREGLGAIPVGELVQRAVRAEFPHAHDNAVRKEVQGKVAARQKQFTSRPRARRGEPLTGQERAITRWDDFYRKQGLLQNTPILDDDVLDGI